MAEEIKIVEGGFNLKLYRNFDAVERDPQKNITDAKDSAQPAYATTK